MKLPRLETLAFVLLLPMPAWAQSVKLTDVVGQWQLVQSSGFSPSPGDSLDILPNGVWYGLLGYDLHNPAFRSRLDLSGSGQPDSVTTYVKVAVAGDSLCDLSGGSRCYNIAFKDNRFTLSGMTKEGEKYSFVYARRAASTPAADLAGTWLGGLADSTGMTAKTTSDTLVIESNGQFGWASDSGAERWSRHGRVTSNTVSFDSGNLLGGPNYQLTLKDQQLLIEVDRTVLEKYVKALTDSGAGGGRTIRAHWFKTLLAKAKPVPQNPLRVVYVFKRVAAGTSKP